MQRHMHDYESVDCAYCFAASTVGLAFGRERVNIYTHGYGGSMGTWHD